MEERETEELGMLGPDGLDAAGELDWPEPDGDLCLGPEPGRRRLPRWLRPRPVSALAAMGLYLLLLATGLAFLASGLLGASLPVSVGFFVAYPLACAYAWVRWLRPTFSSTGQGPGSEEPPSEGALPGTGVDSFFEEPLG